MAGIGDKIYKRMPVPIQHAMVSLYGYHRKRLRFGGNFSDIAARYQSREKFTAEEWETYTTHKLREILVHAFMNVPHYQQVWKGIVTKSQLEKFTREDLSALPPLEKDTARDNPHSLLVGGKPTEDQYILHTSGSSGTPVATYWTQEEHRHSMAVRQTRYKALAGVGYDNPRATFSGRIVEPDPDSRGPFYRFNLAERQVYFSAFHLGPNTVDQYIAALKRHQIQWITGYSNSIYQLAQMTIDQAIHAPRLKAVITTSEKLTPEMREIIEQAFDTTVYEEYSTVENLFFACDNEYGQMLLSPDHGIVEIVDSDFTPLEIGESGEVLATGFNRYGQPMIRYRIGDYAALSDEKPRCGREMPVIKEVSGRIEDTVYGIDGRRMVRFHGIFIDQPHVQEGQIIQERLDLIRVRIVPKDVFSEEDEIDVIGRVQQRLTDAVTVEVEVVESIPRTSSGKFQAVISKVSPEATRDQLTSQ